MSVPEDVSEPLEVRSTSLAVSKMLVVASLFQAQVIPGLYAGLGRRAPEAWPLLSSLCIGVSIIAWFRHYSRAHQISWVVDMGWFLLGAWVVIVPYYVLKREGTRGLARIGLFCLTYFAAWASGMAVRIWVQVLTAG